MADGSTAKEAAELSADDPNNVVVNKGAYSAAIRAQSQLQQLANVYGLSKGGMEAVKELQTKVRHLKGDDKVYFKYPTVGPGTGSEKYSPYKKAIVVNMYVDNGR